MSPLELDERSLDRSAPVPLYRQLADHIRNAIDDGRLHPGEKLPGEQVIATSVGISREMVRTAYDVLAAEGLIVRKQGTATRIAEPPMRRTMSASRYLEEINLLRSGQRHPWRSAFTADHHIGWSEYSVDVEIAQEAATERDAEHLELKAGTSILRREFLKRVRGEVVQLQRSAIPWALAGDTDVADPQFQPWPGGTIAELYSLGIEVTHVTELVEARMPTEEQRRKLDMETPGPVFDMVRVFRSKDGPVEASRVIVPASRAVLHYEIDLSSVD
jgi:GntR family transcriptional regulator